MRFFKKELFPVVILIGLGFLLFSSPVFAACTRGLSGVLCSADKVACKASNGSIRCVDLSECNPDTQACLTVIPPPSEGPTPAYLNYDANDGYLDVNGALTFSSFNMGNGSSYWQGYLLPLTIDGQNINVPVLKGNTAGLDERGALLNGAVLLGEASADTVLLTFTSVDDAGESLNIAYDPASGAASFSAQDFWFGNGDVNLAGGDDGQIQKLNFGGGGEYIYSERDATKDNKWSLNFAVNSENRLIIDDGGFIGVGLAQPTQALDVVGSIKASQDVYMGSGKAIRVDGADTSLNVGNWFGGDALENLQKFVLNIFGSVNIFNGLTVSGPLKFSQGAGANKVLTSDASGNASWQNVVAGGSFATSSLLDVLNKSANASSFVGNVYMGDATHATNLYVNGGEIEGDWLHATNAVGTSTFAGDIYISKNLAVSGTLKFSQGAGAGKVLTSDASGNASWQTAAVGGSFVTSSLLDVLNKNADASSFVSSAKIGSLDVTGSSLSFSGRAELNPQTNQEGLVINSSNYSPLVIKNGSNEYLRVKEDAQVIIGYNNPVYFEVAKNSNQYAINNLAIGKNSLTSNISGLENTAVGNDSLMSNTSGFYNTALGFNSLRSNDGGGLNTAVGWGSLTNNRIGSSNSAVGMGSLMYNTTGSNNSALGYGSLNNNSIGMGNNAFGYGALGVNTTGSGNNAFGANALTANVSSNNNVAIGSDSMSNAIGNNNTAVGNFSLNKVFGSDNLAFGYNAGSGLEIGNRNIFIGVDANVGSDTSISDSIAIGNGTRISADNSILIGNTTTPLVASGVMVLASPKIGINTMWPIAALDVTGQVKIRDGAKGVCNAAGAGNVAYEVTANVGHFYGCVQTGVGVYTWKQLDN